MIEPGGILPEIAERDREMLRSFMTLPIRDVIEQALQPTKEGTFAALTDHAFQPIVLRALAALLVEQPQEGDGA